MNIKKFLNDVCMFVIGMACIVILIITIRHVFRFDRYGAALIDWDDCVKINNIMYYGDFNHTTVENSLIGKKIGKVKFTADGNVGNGDYRFRNGDAAYLTVGTELYSISPNNNAIAVKVNGKYFLYVNNYEDYYFYFRKNNPLDRVS